MPGLLQSGVCVSGSGRQGFQFEIALPVVAGIACATALEQGFGQLVVGIVVVGCQQEGAPERDDGIRQSIQIDERITEVVPGLHSPWLHPDDLFELPGGGVLAVEPVEDLAESEA